MVWDRATIHKAASVQAVAAEPEVDIRLVYNIPARPDLATVGIERVWSQAKRLYRAETDSFKARNLPYDHMGLVKQVMGQITPEFARKMATLALPAVEAGQPI